MFSLEYRITRFEDDTFSSGESGRVTVFDDFPGADGFLEIDCNGVKYGEMYPPELDHVICPMKLRDWLESLLQVAIYLESRDYVVLNDNDSCGVWLEFKRQADDLFISVVRGNMPDGFQTIEFSLRDPEYSRDWGNQKVSFQQFKDELIHVAEKYLQEVSRYRQETHLIPRLEWALWELQGEIDPERDRKKQYEMNLFLVASEVSQSPQWREDIFSLKEGETLEISFRTPEKLPAGIRDNMIEHRLTFFVKRVSECPSDTEEGMVIFKFWVMEYPEICMYSGNDPG